jgi:hypothetical protein
MEKDTGLPVAAAYTTGYPENKAASIGLDFA